MAVDGELHRWSVGFSHSRLVAVHTDLGVPVQGARGREQSSVVHETRSTAVHLSRAEATGVADYCLSNLEVEIYYDYLTLRDVFDPRCFVYYGLHGLLRLCLLSCSRMLEMHCLGGSSLAC